MRYTKGYSMKRRHGKTKRFALGVFAVLLCLIPAFLGVLSVGADAKSTAPVVVVGYYENEVFQEGAAEDAYKKGYAYEYYRKLSEYTGWRYEYVYGSFAELYKKLLDGKIDMLAGLAKTEEREDLIFYPKLAMGNETYDIIRHDDAGISLSAEDFEGRTIGVLDSAMVGALKAFLKEQGYKSEVRVFEDFDGLYESFDSRSIDMVVTEGDGAYGRDDAEVICTFGASEYYLCVSRNRPDLLKELNEAQETLALDEPGYLETLNAKYYSVSMASRALSEPEKQWIETHDSLCVGYLENYLPFSATNTDGNISGMVAELVPKIMEELDLKDIKLTYKGYESYDEMINAMSSGEVDIVFPVGGGLYFSEQNGLYQSKTVISPPPELVYDANFNSDDEPTFAVYEKNRIQYYYIVTHFPDAQFKYYSDIDACLRAVLSDEVNYTLVNGLRAHDIAKKDEYRKLSFKMLAEGDNHCFGVEIGNEGLLKLINRGIKIVGTDYIQSLANRYSGSIYSYGPREFFRDNGVIILVAIGLVTALVIFLLVRDAERKRRLIAKMDAAREELEEKNSELAKSRGALSDALEKAEQASHAKTAFLNNMSHDIRTPMNAIVGFTFMAQRNADNSELVSDYLGKISVSSRHLLSLINDVLDMSRIESGSIKMEETEVHLPELVHELWMIIQSNVSEKNIKLFIDIRDVRNENVITDKLRLNQVLLNILSNAVKFTPEGGAITFRVTQLPGDGDSARFEFRIRDTGIGMSEEFRSTIFDAFTREQTSTVSGIQGTGLGMAITKKIVDMMGGTVEVSSVKGEGSEFIVVIPCKICGEPESHGELEEIRGKRVLVADDDTDNCVSVCEMLRSFGAEAEWTDSGSDAAARAEEAQRLKKPYGMFILDMRMPGVNGVETAKLIRRSVGDDVPIIMITAYDVNGIEAEAREADVTAFCSKPLFPSELREVISKPFREAEAKNAVGEGTAHDFTGKRLLLAEDNEMNRMIAASILEEAGFEVDIAENGEIAVNKVKASPAGSYDAVLMDIQMPVMDGYEAAKQIRRLEDPAKAGIPIVAVTANAFEEDRKIALDAGMNGHLAKPYDIPAMMELLRQLIG